MILKLFILVISLLHACSQRDQYLCDVNAALNVNSKVPSWTCSGRTALTDPCATSWVGLTCSSATASGAVLSIDLSLKSLLGTLPSALGQFSSLTSLSLNGNKVYGSIPTAIGALLVLTLFDLGSNSLTSQIPNLFSNKTNSLRKIALSKNCFSGTLPALINYPTLQVLELSENYFTGTIPSTWKGSNIPAITSISLQKNKIAGSIPTALSTLNNLITLQLTDNSFTSTIPSQIMILTNLVVLSLGGNSFSGSIPTSLTFLSNSLRFLHLNSTNLQGTIPSFLGLFTNMNEISLDSNGFFGSIPTTIANMNKLQALSITFTKLSGTIPSILGNLIQLQKLVLNSNSLQGSIPTLTGLIPTTLNTLSQLSYLDVSYNRLEGFVPGQICGKKLKQLGLIGNSFTCLDQCFTATSIVVKNYGSVTACMPSSTPTTAPTTDPTVLPTRKPTTFRSLIHPLVNTDARPSKRPYLQCLPGQKLCTPLTFAPNGDFTGPNCRTVQEFRNGTFLPPLGYVFGLAAFASFGQPAGSCADSNFQTTSCHSENSMDIVNKLCFNQTYCTLRALTAWFGDPCRGESNAYKSANDVADIAHSYSMYVMPTTIPTQTPTLINKVCGTATEGPSESSTLILQADPGFLLGDVQFASFGNPMGSCGSFRTGSCDATRTADFIYSMCNGYNKCIIQDFEVNFGSGVGCGSLGVKTLAVQMTVGVPTSSPTTAPSRIPTIFPTSNPTTEYKVCDTVDEYSNLFLYAPNGYVLSKVLFASFGTPNGICATTTGGTGTGTGVSSFSTSGCNSAVSVSKISAACVGKRSCTVLASRSIFGDPCLAQQKRLSVEMSYESQTFFLKPTVVPTRRPSSKPTPTRTPTYKPTSKPRMPSRTPTKSPTMKPAVPTTRPSGSPSAKPSAMPTSRPTSSTPTSNPSRIPSARPSSMQPSLRPSLLPTKSASRQPSITPSLVPSSRPSTVFPISFQPSSTPTVEPSNEPSTIPSSSVPSIEPVTYSHLPSSSPSASFPSYSPFIPNIGAFPSLNTNSTTNDTDQPTSSSSSLSFSPTSNPSSKPTLRPSSQSSWQPTVFPTIIPTTTGRPTFRTTIYPSTSPSSLTPLRPSAIPTPTPPTTLTYSPSNIPVVVVTTSTAIPTQYPSLSPSRKPSKEPSLKPQQPLPSRKPSTTAQRSYEPTVKPTTAPTTVSRLCVRTVEFKSLTLIAPRGYFLDKVIFASFGTATGGCGSFSISSDCNAMNSVSIISGSCVGKERCTIAASTSVFGDPCKGQSKWLAVEMTAATYTDTPSVKPTSVPTYKRTALPSSNPSEKTSRTPSSKPIRPTRYPSVAPTPPTQPTYEPTVVKTYEPTAYTSITPSASTIPTSEPTVEPSTMPSPYPSIIPTFIPSNKPTAAPKSFAPIKPSSRPSKMPSSIPTLNPTFKIKICGYVAEYKTLHLTASSGFIFSDVLFASFGTPTGSCPAPIYSTCSASNSIATITMLCVGKSFCSITASTSIFGDPCQGQSKVLVVSLLTKSVVNVKTIGLDPSLQPTVGVSTVGNGEPTGTYPVPAPTTPIYFNTSTSITMPNNTNQISIKMLRKRDIQVLYHEAEDVFVKKVLGGSVCKKTRLRAESGLVKWKWFLTIFTGSYVDVYMRNLSLVERERRIVMCTWVYYMKRTCVQNRSREW
eukprot:gene3123-6143_t